MNKIKELNAEIKELENTINRHKSDSMVGMIFGAIITLLVLLLLALIIVPTSPNSFGQDYNTSTYNTICEKIYGNNYVWVKDFESFKCELNEQRDIKELGIDEESRITKYRWVRK